MFKQRYPRCCRVIRIEMGHSRIRQAGFRAATRNSTISTSLQFFASPRKINVSSDLQEVERGSNLCYRQTSLQRAPMDSLLELCCHVDDFCTASLEQLSARRPRGRRPSLCMSEIMPILKHFHQSNYRNFKAFYLEHVMTHLRNEFPGLVSSC